MLWDLLEVRWDGFKNCPSIETLKILSPYENSNLELSFKVCKENAWKTAPHNQRSEKPTYLQVNTYYVDSHFTGEVANFLTELVAELKGEKYFNDTDIKF